MRRAGARKSSWIVATALSVACLVGAGNALAADPGIGDRDHRGAYCLNGTFLDLEYRQPDVDARYAGAVLAWFVQGKGLTCDPPPAGYVAFTTAPDEYGIPGQLYAWWVPPTAT